MTDNEKMTKILGDLMTITDPQCLRTIQNTAFNRARDVRQAKAQVDTATWRIGQKLQLVPECRRKKPYGAVGELIKINKVKMQVKFGSITWNIPKAMLMKAE